MHVIIIGAGTGGLALAQGLKKAGISSAVYERDRTRSDGLYGYRVGIDPDGSRALRTVLPGQIFDTFAATCARTPRYMNMLTEKYRQVFSSDALTDNAPGADATDVERSVSRMTLRQVLLTGLEDRVYFDKTFTHYEQHHDGTVTAHFADGTSATGDLLVAADGSGSRVRKQYLPHAQLQDTGLVGVTGKVPLDERTAKLLTDKVRHGVTLVFAPRGYTCIVHVMEFPWDQDGAPRSGIGSTDTDLINTWPGLQFDNSRDYIMWGFAGARRNLPTDIDTMTGPQLHALVGDLTSSWHPHLRELFALADPNSCFPLSIRTSVPVEQWPSSNVTLLGDSIHTMTPGRGVGANTALRDAALLTRKLTAAHDNSTPLLTAVRDYETKMIAYSREAVEKSLDQMSGDSAMHKPVVGRVVLACMRTAMQIVNRMPRVKRRMAASEQALRGHDRDE
jgi:2-polyprenyl-6-methoxyphenol hydroxylase-like FAD-dependent oxidoreductase